MSKKTLYRLKDRGTIFTDPDSNFVISGDQRKRLPKKVGSVLAARVRTGALIKADDQPKGGESKPPEESEKSQAETAAGKQAEKSEESQAKTAAGGQAEKSEEKPAEKSDKKSGKNK